MAVITGKDNICREISDALGLESFGYITDVDLKMHLGEIVSVTVRFYPEKDGMAKLPAVIKKYNLKLVEEEPEEKE